jgi:phosphohistidine phosphatase
MDLILWRHAEAIELEMGGDDMQRHLTVRGERQAQRMARWLDRMLPQGTRIFSSPAKRCEQTVLALGRRYKTREELSPNGDAQGLLELVQWPVAKNPVLVVAHQPFLGQTVAQLLQTNSAECSFKKGSIWWIKTKKKEDTWVSSIYCVVPPETI